jgi:hypothetical protein
MTRAAATTLQAPPVIPVDSLVRGTVGSTDRTLTMRVYLATVWGWVGGLDSQGQQWIMYPGRFRVVGKPRPEKARTDIPERLKVGRPA